MEQSMEPAQLKELVLQALTHEKGGVLVYQTALECAVNGDLKKEWEEYLDQTRSHVEALTGVCEALGVDPGELTPACQVVQHMGKALVTAMKMALAGGDAAAAQLVACDCVVLAETKDHANWELLGACVETVEGRAAEILAAAYDRIEDEEDEHLYHSRGWGRELWRQSLGLKAILPPSEERQDVKSAVEAAKVKEKVEPARKH
jgi:hypothetical protein